MFASVAKVHNRINETFFDGPQEYAPCFAQKADGRIDPRPWCRGFYAAMNLNLRDWKPLLIRGNINCCRSWLIASTRRECRSSASRGRDLRPPTSSRTRRTSTSRSSCQKSRRCTTRDATTPIVKPQRQRGMLAPLTFLPPYSSEFNPIEIVFSRLKAMLTKIRERTVSGLWSLIGKLVDIFQPIECANYFSSCGYVPD